MAHEDRALEIARAAAEEILRLIYGDDLTGCTVSLDQVAGIISEALRMDRQLTLGQLDAYEKSAEAVIRLSSPPALNSVTTPAELHSLLSDRLDAIHQLTTQLLSLQAHAKLRPPLAP